MDPGTTVTCRPAFWIRWLWPVAVLTFGAGAVTAALEGSWVLLGLYAALVVLFVWHGVTTLRQVLTVDAVGLRGHTGSRPFAVAWEDVAVLEIPRRRTFADTARVHEHSGRLLRLQVDLPGACREHLLRVAREAAEDHGATVRSLRR